jgi:hypothetical protein
MTDNTPRWKKKTPCTDPFFQAAYEEVFNQYLETHNQSRALELTARDFSVSVTTIRYHVFPNDKKVRKKYNQKRYEKNATSTESKRPLGYKKKYVHIRRHLNSYIIEAFSSSDSNTLTLEQMSDSIREQTEISLRPSTIESCVKQIEPKLGYRVLYPVTSEHPIQYMLNPIVEKS